MCNHLKKTLIYENHFDVDNGDFIKEGNGNCEIKDGKIYMDVSLPAKGGQTVWLNKIFEGNLYISYEAMVVEPLQACNVNLFFMGTTLDGDNVINGNYTGRYEEYHERAKTYIFTLTGDNINGNGLKGHTRVRKDPGFFLLSENLSLSSQMNTKYFIEITKIDGEIECKVNGEIVHKVIDDEPYNKGSIGFRTWNTKLWFDNFKVYSLSK
jgi:hypothetical protein